MAEITPGCSSRAEKVGWGRFYDSDVYHKRTGMTWGSCWEGTEGWFATGDVTQKKNGFTSLMSLMVRKPRRM